MTSHLSVMGDIVSDRAVIECETCHRLMAKWEYAEHPCDLVQLIATVPSSQCHHKFRVEFAGVHVATIERQGSKLLWYPVGEKVPTTIYGGQDYSKTGVCG